MSVIQITQSLRNKLTTVMAVLSVMGIVSFSLFILEESFQTIMFGTWPAQDAGDWRQVRRGIKMMKATARTIDIVNYSIGWVQPLSFISYRSYAKSARFYTESLEKKVFARAPELFEGEHVSFEFYPKQIRGSQGRFEASNGKVHVILSEKPKRPSVEVSGILTIDSGGKLIVDAR